MCGISGSINRALDFAALKEVLRHRGPDAQEIYTHKNITLFHARLAIQDLSNAGAQPMESERYVIVFNGEIYNHAKLREQYLQTFSFKGHSDTETLLRLYEIKKEGMLELLDGMFAFCIYDKSEGSLFLARDRAGKKPLYFYNKGQSFVFASELNTLKKVLLLEIEEQNIYEYLRIGFCAKSHTVYKNVQELEAGSYLKIDRNLRSEAKRYFHILDYYKKPKIDSFEESLRLAESALETSVKERIESSDLEVGTFLSGGIDSSLVTALASKYAKNLKSFTIRFQGGYDESHLAALTAKKYGTNHHVIDISMNLKEDIFTILNNYGEPFFDSSAIPSYYVSAAAKEHLTVILNGDGADEIFGGYRRYVPLANGWIGAAKKFAFLTKILPKPHQKKSLYNYAYRLLAMADKRGLDFYLSATNDIFEDAYSFTRGDFSVLESFIESVFNENISQLSKMLVLDFELLLAGDLLVKMDIATMAHSLEGRSPFLSKAMLELAPQIKDEYKIRGKSTKHILRKLSEKHLPRELLDQPKRGFEVPLKQWVENDLHTTIKETLHKNCYARNFIQSDFLDKLLQNKIDISAEKRAKMLWNLFALEVWKNNL